ncbi:hypothetical protein Ciccas_006118, partial [Cichlidogyrus casuarinus]
MPSASKHYEISGYPPGLIGSKYLPLISIDRKKYPLTSSFFYYDYSVDQKKSEEISEFDDINSQALRMKENEKDQQICQKVGVPYSRCFSRWKLMLKMVPNLISWSQPEFTAEYEKLKVFLLPSSETFRMINVFSLCVEYAHNFDPRDSFFVKEICPNACSRKVHDFKEVALPRGYDSLHFSRHSLEKRSLPCAVKMAKTHQCKAEPYSSSFVDNVMRYWRFGFKCQCQSEAKGYAIPSYWNDQLKICEWDVNWLAVMQRRVSKNAVRVNLEENLSIKYWSVGYNPKYLESLKCDPENTEEILPTGKLNNEDKSINQPLYEAFGDGCVCKSGFHGKFCEK